MRTFFTATLACLLATVVLSLTGCNKHYDEEYTTTNVVPVAPIPPYPLMDDKAKGISYAVLQEGSVATKEIDKWTALSPEFFAKLSGITVTAPAPDKTVHAGYGYIMPKIEASEQYPERKVTSVSANYLIPKELNGWVAISHDTFEKLAKDFMTAK